MPDQKTTSGSSSKDSNRTITTAENARTGWSEDQAPGPSEFMKQQAMARLNKDRRHVASGNLADLDRLGRLAVGQDAAAAFLLPPGYSKEDVTTQIEKDAAQGVYNVGTAGMGLVDEPPAPVSGDGHKEPVVVDPGSQSPRVVEEGKSTPSPQAK